MKNKKIGIATIALNNSYNYGNKMQIYALQCFLRMHGCDPVTIRYESDYVKKAPTEQRMRRLEKLTRQSVWQSVCDAFRLAKRSACKRKLERLRHERERKFAQFENRYISYTEKTYDSGSDFSELVQRCDYFITGSDQVWNPRYEGTNAFFYLDFAPEGKRIAYAPSIARSTIPDALKGQYRQWLGQMDRLSIRETAGRELIKAEFGLDAKVVCDPVFLLSKEKWSSIAADPQIKKPYFAVYILGKKTVEINKLIRTYEKKYRLAAVDVYSKDDTGSFFAGPEEFLGLIENAEFVLTDSFHATAFSAIFLKPMVVLDRNGNTETSSRVDGLLRILGIENRNAAQILENPERMPIDYSDVSERMAAFVEDSKAYLLTAVQ